MKKIILIFTLLITSTTMAATKAHFWGFQAMIQIFGTENGSTNPDPALLYEFMNVTEQGSVMGPGKGIVSKDKILNFTCAKQSGYQCSILVRAAPNVKMDPSNRRIEFQAQGSMIEELSSQFHLNDKRELIFISTDRLFKLEIVPGKFNLIYDGNGI